ncbi:unnamed protein product [Miscanthus lutarioriparius]|uniref:Uncharacterized protein n=1 Tax=Miscanthus lutarioriparius TaxID=422564 RepID=A0A811SH47_9POAL|nr:unnamed protein product [Miscanthus lutarioriparius]
MAGQTRPLARRAVALAPSHARARLRKLDIMVYLRLKFIAASNTDTFSNPTILGTSDPLYTNKMHD